MPHEAAELAVELSPPSPPLLTMTPANPSPARSARPWHTGQAVHDLIGESNRAKAVCAMGMGMTLTTMYRWLKRPDWPMRVIEKASAYLGVTPEWLMTGQGPKYAAVTGAHDPQAMKAEALYITLKAEMELLLAQYTRSLAKLYSPNAKALPTPKGKQREWNPRPTDNPFD